MSLKLGGASAAAVKELMNQGITTWSKPKYEMPVLPKDLTALDDDDLMLLFALITSWSDYVNGQVAAAQVDERSCQKRLSFTENSLLVKQSATAQRGDRVTMMKAAIACDPKVVALGDELDELYAYRKMVESIAENLERDSALVSRELTRRTASLNRASRSKYTT